MARFSKQFLGIAAGDLLLGDDKRGARRVEWAKYLGADQMQVFPEGGAMVVKFVGNPLPRLYPALANIEDHSLVNMSR